MKASIDNKMPKQASHLKTNGKKMALMEARFADIERENRMLLEKMSYIIAKKGGVDNKNDSMQYGRSLNKDRRKRELQKITKQNQTILSRIQESQPTYDHLTWAEEARINHQHMVNVCEFKPKRGGRGATQQIDDGAEPDNF
jgi:E3 ubiquitin-protein ligase TRIP12